MTSFTRNPFGQVLYRPGRDNASGRAPSLPRRIFSPMMNASPAPCSVRRFCSLLRACQVFCVWGSFISLEVGVDSLGVSEGQLGERLLPVGRHCSLNELARC